MLRLKTKFLIVALFAMTAVPADAIDPTLVEARTTMHITITANGKNLVYTLNDSQASNELVDQLPLHIKVEDYGGKEKIFYPPHKLGTSETPLAQDVRAGTLAYYAPWGDVVMFYADFRPASGLYELGRIVSGLEDIPSLSGTIEITAQ